MKRLVLLSTALAVLAAGLGTPRASLARDDRSAQALASPAASPSDSAELAQLTAARDRLQADLPLVQQRAGHDVAFGLGVRLLADMDTVRDAGQPPDGYTQAELSEHVSGIVRLDTKLADEMLSGTVETPATVHGLDERLMRSADGTLQPYAIYVPAGANSRSPLIVLLHGLQQTEVELLSAPYLHQLADATNAIVVAPWGRGIYDYAPPASGDVYQIAGDVRAAFGLSPHRVFLAGYSMGGFTVYKIAPMHPEIWSGVMSVSGAILSSETADVSYRLRSTPIYVVTGSNDKTVPAAYGEETAGFLAAAGLPVSFYEQHGGTHSLATLVPSLTLAWNDMLSGRVRQSNIPIGLGKPPTSEPGGAAVKN
jgi:predicted esterase